MTGQTKPSIKKLSEKVLSLTIKSLTYLAIAFAGLFALVLLALFAANFISLNAYRADIEKMAADNGIGLQIQGDIQHRILYPVSIVLNDVKVRVAPADDADEFVVLHRLELSVSPLALLQKELKIDRAVIDGLSVVTKTYPDGTNSISRFIGALQAASPPSPPQPEKAVDPSADTFDIFAFNLIVGKIDIRDVSFRSADGNDLLTLSDVYIRTENLSLDRPNTVYLGFKTGITQNNEEILQYDANATIRFQLNRQTKKVTLDSLDFTSTVNHELLPQQELNVSAGAVFDIERLALESADITLDVPNILKGRLAANGEFADTISADFSADLKIDRLQTITDRFLNGDTSNKDPVPVSLMLAGRFQDDAVKLDTFNLGIAKSALVSREVSYSIANGMYSVAWDLSAPDLPKITGDLGLPVFRTALPVYLSMSGNGTVPKMLHRLNMKGRIGELQTDLEAFTRQQSQDTQAFKVLLTANSPDIVQEIEAFRETGFTNRVPLDVLLDLSGVIDPQTVAVNRFIFDLNKNITLAVSGGVNAYKTDPLYDLNVDFTAKDLKRIIALFTKNAVTFQPDALQDIALGVNLSGSSKEVTVSRLYLENADIFLDGQLAAVFEPLSIKAAFTGKRLKTDAFIPDLRTPDAPTTESSENTQNETPVPDQTSNTTYTPNPVQPLVSFGADGSILFSDQPLSDIVPIPDLDATVSLDWQGIEYQALDPVRVELGLNVRRKTSAEVRLSVSQAQHTSLSGDLSVGIEANRQLSVQSAVQVRTDLSQHTKVLPFLLDGDIDLSMMLTGSGNTLESLVRQSEMQTDLSLTGVAARSGVLPVPFTLDAAAQLRLKNRTAAFSVSDLRLANQPDAVPDRRFLVGLDQFRVQADAAAISQGELNVLPLEISGVQVDIFSDESGLFAPGKQESSASATDSVTENPSPPVQAADSAETAAPAKASNPPGFPLKVTVGPLHIADVSFLLRNLSTKTQQRAGLQNVSLTGNDLSYDKNRLSAADVALTVEGLSFTDPSNDMRLPRLDVQLAALNVDPAEGNVTLDQFLVILPELKAAFGGNQLENTGLQLDVRSLAVNRYNAFPEGFDVRFASVALTDQRTEFTDPDAKNRIELKDTALNIKAPGGLNAIELALNANTGITDTSSDATKLLTLNAEGTVGVDLPQNRQSVELVINTDLVNNALNGQRLTLNLETKARHSGNDGSLAIDRFVLQAPDLLDANLSGNLVYLPAKLAGDMALSIAVNDLNKILQISGIETPDRQIPVHVALDMKTSQNGNDTQIQLTSRQFQVGKSMLSLDARVDSLRNNQAFAVQAGLTGKNLKDSLDGILAQPLEMADPDALNHLALSLDAGFADQQLDLNVFRLELDQTTLTAKGFRQMDSGKTRLKVNGANFNLDHYLPPPPPEEAEPEEEEAESDTPKEPYVFPETPLLSEELTTTLRALDISADVDLRNITANNIVFDQILLSANMLNGDLRFSPQIRQGKGVLALLTQMDLKTDEPAVNVNLSVDQYPLERITKPVLKENAVIGQLDVGINLETAGNSQRRLVDNLDGKINVRFTKGLYPNFNADYYACIGLAALSFDWVNSEDFPKETIIRNVSIDGRIANGTVRLHDIFSDLITLNATANSRFDIISQEVDSTAYLSIVEAKTNYCKIPDTLKKFVLKTDCTGPVYDVDKVKCAPDYGAISSLLLKGIGGRASDVLSFYQGQLDQISSVVISPFVLLRTTVVKLFRGLGSGFANSSNQDPDATVSIPAVPQPEAVLVLENSQPNPTVRRSY